ncbi:MAG: AIR synthase-related protein, partial [Planctomycetota bacterium]
DCGAGGLSSAVGEMGAELGAIVDLEKVPLKYAGLRYDEIWISEAQERMVFAVPPDRIDRFLSVFTTEEVEAKVIGTFTDDRILRVRYNGSSVGELEMAFLHDGLPRTVRTASWHPEPRGGMKSAEGGASATPLSAAPGPKNDKLLQSLGALNVASKEWVIRQYDHEVQGRSVIKPLVGPGFGPSDAAVLRPRYTSHRGIAIGCGLCPEWTEVDPYWMAVRAIDEALRNVICVGGDPGHTAILDNFCWPKCDSEESLGALVRACRGASDAAIAYGLPFISGKDSLNNEFSMNADEARRTGLPQRIAIPGTLLVSALAQIQDVRQCVSMDLKEPDNRLVLASAPVDRLGMDRAKSLHHHVSQCIR